VRHFGEAVRKFARGVKAATVFIIGSEAILQVCQVRRQRLGNRRDRCRVLYEFGPGDLGRDTLTRVFDSGSTTL